MLTATLLPLAAITGLGKTVLIIVAGTFIIWSLVTALSIPKRHPNFPENMGVYLTITAVLFLAQMAAVVGRTGPEVVEEEERVAQEAGAGEKPAEGETGAETTATAAGDPVAGKVVFTASCGGCHTLADAGASGSVGPNLDEAKPSVELVSDRVTNGLNGMPSFKGQLEEKQIEDVSAYVSSAAGQ